MNLVQINQSLKSFRMKDGSGEFLARKTVGGSWYLIIFSNGQRLRHTADVVERLAEPIPVEVK